MARPKKPCGESRSLVIRVRVNQAEQQKLKTAAKEAGYTISDWLRHKGADIKPRFRIPTPEMEILHKLLAMLGRCGSLTNQIARQLNRKSETDEFEIPVATINHTMEEMKQLMANIREKIDSVVNW